jgi:hypothetical protein
MSIFQILHAMKEEKKEMKKRDTLKNGSLLQILAKKQSFFNEANQEH